MVGVVEGVELLRVLGVYGRDGEGWDDCSGWVV